MQDACEFRGGFLLYAVEPELTRPPSGKQHCAQGLFPLLREHPGRKLRKLRTEADELLLPARAEGTPGREVINCFQKICLAVGVAADKQIHTGDEFRPRLAVIAEVPQRKTIELHPRPDIPRR